MNKSIFTEEHKKLIESITSEEMPEFRNVYNTNKFISNPSMNKKGQHIFRSLYSELCMDNKRKQLGLDKHPNYEEFMKNGYLAIENILSEEEFNNISQRVKNIIKSRGSNKDNDGRIYYSTNITIKNSRISGILAMCSGSKSVPSSYRINHIVHDNRFDEQHNLHIDTCFPSFKAWIYIDDVTEDEGPFHFVKGSTVKTKERLEYDYQCSLISENRSHPEYFDINSGNPGSFRVHRNSEEGKLEKLKKMGLEKEIPMTFPKNTLVVANVNGFHKRGVCKKDHSRLSLEISVRGNPF